MAIRSITLDLDGTLLDTAPDLAAAANAMRTALGHAALDLATLTSFVGRGIPNLVSRCLPELEAAQLPAAEDLFREHYAHENGRRSRPYPGVIDGLNAFAAAGLRLAVVTNKSAAFTEPLLVSSGLAPWFAFAVSGDTTLHKKPHPAPLLHACAQLGVRPEENLHIGDSRHDAAAARAAGCPVALVPYGYNEGEDIRGVDCDAHIGCLAEALRLFA
jgi:phosphoglycolate phosphatase